MGIWTPPAHISTGADGDSAQFNEETVDNLSFLFEHTLQSCTSTTRPTTGLTAGRMMWETDTKSVIFYDGTSWICITPKAQSVAADVDTTSTSYVSLTGGPAVTLQTGTKALVTLDAAGYLESATVPAHMSVAVSGATILAGDDVNSHETSSQNGFSHSRTFLLTGLTAGANTFTAKYRVVANHGHWYKRTLSVVGYVG